MPRFATEVRRFLQEEDGPAAIEYAVMLALIVVGCMNVVSLLGKSSSTTFSKINSSMSS